MTARSLLRTRAPELAIVVFAILLRISMRWTFDIRWAYDYDTHHAYVRWLVDHGSLPRFDLNAESYHPPLYYVLAAKLLRAGARDQSLAWISILAGCLRMVLLWIGLELYLPGRRIARVGALALAAILPAALHVDAMASNEALCALFSLAATLFMPPLMAEEPRRRRIAALGFGVSLGLALMSKLSALMLLPALAAGLGLDLLWRWRAGMIEKRALLRSLGPAVLAAAVTLAISGWFFARNKVLYGKFAPNSYDGPGHWVVDEMRHAPYLDRRTFGYLLGFEKEIFADPFYPKASLPHARFHSILIAATFVDYYNFGFAPRPRPGEPTVVRQHRTMTQAAFDTSRFAIKGGTLIFLATGLAWIGAVRRVWRARRAALLALLLIPLAAILGQLHFAFEYPNDTWGPVKGQYLQFAAPVMFALFGLALEWLWRRRHLGRAAALVLVLAGLGVAAYTLTCRLSRLPAALADPIGASPAAPHARVPPTSARPAAPAVKP